MVSVPIAVLVLEQPAKAAKVTIVKYAASRFVFIPDFPHRTYSSDTEPYPHDKMFSNLALMYLGGNHHNLMCSSGLDRSLVELASKFK